VLVQLQGEMIDNIEQNIKDAKADVLHGEEDIIQSKKNMISARKKKCIIMIIVLVLLAVIIGPVLGVKLGSA
jgi:t-SNARE complex subunit (syntaxin)